VRIHAIRTGTVAIHERQVAGKGSSGLTRLVRTLLDRRWTEPLPIYAWVIEHDEGVIVVDTGETALATKTGYFPRWHPYYRLAVRSFVEPAEEIGPQLQAMGISPDSVRWVVMTHMHTDHAGGLHHFPKAEVLVSQEELATASGFMGRARGYLNNHWPDWFSPTTIDFDRERIGPFDRSLALTRAGDVRIVPTEGHTPGHVSVLVQQDGKTVFLAGDASYTQQHMLDESVDGVAPNPRQARVTLQRIRSFVEEIETVYLPNHDAASGDRLAQGTVVRV